MHRCHLLELMERYQRRYPGERDCVTQITRFVQTHPGCFLRSCVPGHVTGSAWVTTPDATHCILTHHAVLDRWLQPGGHADGEPEVHRTALREAQEETGLWGLRLDGRDRDLVPVDVDVHRIPPHRGEPAHVHYDIRFVVLAAAGQQPRASCESHEVRWFGTDSIAAVTTEESVLRMLRKVREMGRDGGFSRGSMASPGCA